MGTTSPLTPSERGPLGEYLWDLRQAAGMSLRGVEKASGEQVSNAYLSQLETGKIPNPSPAILHELAEVYQARLPKKRAHQLLLRAHDGTRRPYPAGRSGA